MLSIHTVIECTGQLFFNALNRFLAKLAVIWPLTNSKRAMVVFCFEILDLDIRGPFTTPLSPSVTAIVITSSSSSCHKLYSHLWVGKFALSRISRASVLNTCNSSTLFSVFIKLSTYVFSSLPLMLNRKRNASQSSSLILICKNVFSMSASRMCVDIRARIMIPHRRGCSRGPVYMLSFMLFDNGCGFALVSKTILTFVVSGSFLFTGLWGM